MKIKFWPNKNGLYMTSASGLTPLQLNVTQNLKVGDRLTIWVEDDGTLSLVKSKFAAIPKEERTITEQEPVATPEALQEDLEGRN